MNNLERLNKWFVYYFPMRMLTQMLTAMRFPVPDFIWSYIFDLFWIVLCYNSFKLCRGKVKNLFTLLMCYFLLSVFAYTTNGISLYCYYRELFCFFLPFLFVYSGMVNTDNRIYKYFIYSVLFCDVIGIYLHFIRPGWYISYKMQIIDSMWYLENTIVDESDLIYNGLGRFSSFFSNSYPVAFYSTFALVMVLDDFCKPKDIRLLSNRKIQILSIAILSSSIVLSMARVAMAFTVIAFVYYYLTLIRFRNPTKKKFLWLFLSLFILFTLMIYIVSLTSMGRDILDVVFSRFETFDIESLSTGREHQNADVLESWKNILFGDGLGSKGGTAAMLGYIAITDGGWTRFLVEYGVFGMLLFIIVLIKSLFHSWHYRAYLSKELLIVGYGIVSMIGANSLGMSDSIIIFWFALGRIWNNNYLDKKIFCCDKI